jgi:Fe-S-cluster containining protein
MATLLARRKRFQGQEYLRFRCTDCGNCCTDTIVPVTDQDVSRLMLGTGLPALEMLAFYRASEFADEGVDLLFVELDQGPRVMALKRRYDEKEEREACKFYQNQRCTAYEYRPITCRVWPFSLSLDAEGKRIKRMEINDDLPCPYELDGEQDPAALLANWKADDAQDDSWKLKVEEWNRLYAGGTPEQFLSFLKLT